MNTIINLALSEREDSNLRPPEPHSGALSRTALRSDCQRRTNLTDSVLFIYEKLDYQLLSISRTSLSPFFISLKITLTSDASAAWLSNSFQASLSTIFCQSSGRISFSFCFAPSIVNLLSYSRCLMYRTNWISFSR